MRLWDVRTANGVDEFIAISDFIARRIWKVYRREAEIIYPPVDVEDLTVCEKKEAFYLTASRLVPYKRIDLIIDAFSKLPDKKLMVIGDGPEFGKLERQAPANVELMGFQSTRVLRDYLQRARAFIFAAEEDFGILPLEAQACGTPVIAFGKGGALETIIPGKTGLFFHEQTPECIVEVIQRFERREAHFTVKTMRQNAERFSKERFQHQFMGFVENAWQKHISRNRNAR